ncbi:unnamed protein product [Miscanthus lutarioriparius]|uniref:Uncharacterized protein n=1 Tax=Miscanthus lutarioriparius TaxID=422564 RepID=A0A811NMA2_9POAL|nr:unnamed protein product [Miscanthus lutarioriparius]
MELCQTVNSFWRTNQILVSSKGKHRDLDFVQMLFEEKGTSPVAQPAITECGRGNSEIYYYSTRLDIPSNVHK